MGDGALVLLKSGSPFSDMLKPQHIGTVMVTAQEASIFDQIQRAAKSFDAKNLNRKSREAKWGLQQVISGRSIQDVADDLDNHFINRAPLN